MKEVFDALVNAQVAEFASWFILGKEGLLEALTKRPVKWEHQIEKNWGSFSSMPEFLGKYGRDGWETVTLLPPDELSTVYRAVLRRPIYEPK